MLKFIGFITKQMYHTQNKEMISPDLCRYKLPIEKIDILDINKKVSFDEVNNTIVFETLKEKSFRTYSLYLAEKKDGFKEKSGIDRVDTGFESDEDDEIRDGMVEGIDTTSNS